ncbi:serine hydrolase [Xanthomarina sp. F2636L]|uniref:serine hydrolase n=1 Tax=Xanthomarina sp. F2636L TaxID=2996018 RepID=UPI00225E4F08|nr:serine hydrolase [Xanthomarina sp. F2636L]MCX7550652.1 serine hydrolase [Xanthomarina sp. F2636L]
MKPIKSNPFTLSLCLFFVLNISVFAQLSSVQVDSLVNDALDKFKVAGVAVAIVKDGKIIHEKGYGVTSKKTNIAVNEHTNFAIASNSKAFTTTALALLVEDGIIKWTDKVKDHIPEFKMYNAYVTENFNIQDLLTHRSGLGLGVGDLMFFPDGSDFTIEDLLSSFQYFKPVSAFRTQFDYDNLLYIVAGELIARVSGVTWEAFISERIFKPLQMDNSYAGLSLITDSGNLALPHNTASGDFVVLPNFQDMINGAAGGIYSNVNDISQWMLMHLNQGKYGHSLESQLFSVENQYEMWKIHTTTDVNRNPRYNSHFAGYGLGWDLTDKKGNMIVSHTGGLPGMLSRTVLVPDLNVGIVVLTNTEPGGAGLFLAVSRTIIDGYLGLDDFEWSNKFYEYFKARESDGDQVTKEVWETVETNKKVKINQSDYIGVYKDNWFGIMEVFNKNGKLWIKSHRSPKLHGEMQFYKANTFAVKWEYQDMNADAFAMFSLDENGKAQHIKMKGISPNIDFSFDFHDLDLKRVTKD